MATQQTETPNIINFEQHLSDEQNAEIQWRLYQKTIGYRFRKYRRDLLLADLEASCAAYDRFLRYL
jgi:hypothetical protein